MPSSWRSTSRQCSPKLGAQRTGGGAVRARRQGTVAIQCVPVSGCVTRRRNPRCRHCGPGSAKAGRKFSTRAAATPAAARAAASSAASLPEHHSASSASRSSSCSLRPAFVAKRGSSMPARNASAAHAASVSAASASHSSLPRTAKTPCGATRGWRFPAGARTRPFAENSAMASEGAVHATASIMAADTRCPRPERSRWRRAARMAAQR
mmetsp:Transcript_88865/g.276268  ORF Transcript_88865/g.276268 Transcript_88865/m.276268 type:complete len:209 (-) Transcript_88865:643-1269(-)